LKHKGSGYVIIDGDLSEKDQIIITKYQIILIIKKLQSLIKCML